MSERPGPPPELYPLTEEIAFSRNQPPLTRDLMERFGGRGFLYNLRFWEARTRGGTESSFYVPPEDHYRPRFETLARTGVALAGDGVSLELMFKALPLKVLRKAAKDLEAGTLFRTARAAGKSLAAIPTARAWLEKRYSVQNFFLLRADTSVPYKEVETLWAAYRREALAQLGLGGTAYTMTIQVNVGPCTKS